MKTYRLISRNANEARFADPDAFFDTTSVKVNVQPKKAGAITVYNAKSGISMQRTATLPQPVGCTDSCAPLNQEKLALNFNLSGSTQSKTAVKQLIADFRSALIIFEDDMVAGFITDVETLESDVTA